MPIGWAAMFIRPVYLQTRHLKDARLAGISRMSELRREHRAFQIIPNDTMTLEMMQATDAAGARARLGSRTSQALTYAISWTRPMWRRPTRSRRDYRG